MVRQLVRSRFAQSTASGRYGGDNVSTSLPPGYMRLYSYYKPSLEAGRYKVTTEQVVTAPKWDPAVLDSKASDPDTAGPNTPQPQIRHIHNATDDASTTILAQEFDVVAPQFALDPKLIDSHYPPDGHLDEARILPHLVFKDPHVPWLRSAGHLQWMENPIDSKISNSCKPTADPNAPYGDKIVGDGQNLVPWMALMVFRPDELLVTGDTDLPGILTKITNTRYDAQKPPSSGAYPMQVSEYAALDPKFRVAYDADDEWTDIQKDDTMTSVIFPTKARVAQVFGGRHNIINRISGLKLAAHVREINTMGFPDAGVEEVGMFSVVMSTMTGDVKEIGPTTHIVHLVSVEHLDETFSPTVKNPNKAFQDVWTDTSPSGRVGLVSLYSWTYTCIPDAISFKDTMAGVARSSQPLRPPKETLNMLAKSAAGSAEDRIARSALHARLKAGYTVSRWRAATGEESIALNRGPLTPVSTRDVPATDEKGQPLVKDAPWPAFSMTGKDYSVFDKSLGMLDVAYSSAWSMGRLMAISDSAFNAALMRLRNSIGKVAASDLRLVQNEISGAEEVLKDLQDQMKKAATLASGTAAPTAISRLSKPGPQRLARPVDHPDNALPFFNAVSVRMREAATTAAGDGLHNGVADKPINNSDFEIVANWVYDAMYLGHMPAHVLFPDPSHLVSFNPNPKNVQPGHTQFIPEALRFFYIDHAWIDCFIDGALSCANHHEPESDWTRIAIKRVINQALQTEVGDTGLTPPIPRYGFILRSAAVKAVPDIRLTVHKRKLGGKDGRTWVADDDALSPLIRHTRLDDTTILSLIDCSPEEIALVRFSQPPHQRRFAMQLRNTDQKANLPLLHMYTDALKAPPLVPDLPPSVTEDDETRAEWGTTALDTKVYPAYPGQDDFYDPETRLIDPLSIAQTMNDAARALLADKYTSNTPTSVVLGLQLNDLCFQLQISEIAESSDWPLPTSTAWTRKLWDGGDTYLPPDPTDDNSSKPNMPPTHIQSLVLPPTSRDAPQPSAKAWMNTSAITPLPISVAVPRSIPCHDTTGAFTWIMDPTWYKAPPAIQTGSPFFELLVHPSYRAPSPRPQRATNNTQWTGPVYSPQDFLPTRTTNRYDLVFAIRRRIVAPWDNRQPPPQLKTIYVEIPIADDDDVKNGREPLLSGADFSEMGVRMCGNPHFIPTLYTGGASNSGGNKAWDGKRVLIIVLMPRSSKVGSTIEVKQDGRTKALGVRLTTPRLADVGIETKLSLMGKDHKPAHGGMMAAGVVMVKMTEVYEGMIGGKMVDMARWSWYTANKVATGDTDPRGNAI